MSDMLKELKKYHPDCACFKDPDGELVRTGMSGEVSKSIGSVFLPVARDEYGFCDAALPYVLDDVIINIATIIAIQDTIIECGSVEAEAETVRVLTGMEARIIEKVRVVSKYAREAIARGKLPRVNGRGEKIEGGNA